ncbi:MAG TPA: efflux transporter outer membrane subunit [Mariprofundaceae bacterium]|nr:efflux transporter outer membrane subunit [Mariprofundaceae bacterium]
MILQRSMAAIGIVLLAGCAVGPDFKQPAAPKTDHYTSLKLTLELPEAATGQKLLAGGEVPAQWWQLFGSEPLNRLVEQGLASSPTVTAAEAKLREAEENLNAQVGAVLYPTIDAKASASRQKISGASFGGRARIYNLYNASVSASYGLDLFGGSRRYLEGLRSQIDYAQYELQAARLTLAANIVTAAVKEASLRGQIAATRQMISDSESQLAMIQQQYEQGAVAQKAVLSQQSDLARIRATLPALQKQLEQNRNLLNVLAGRLPADGGLPEFGLDTLHLPATLPLSLPSELVRQRPDILAAEALLHQASANVGVATANMYPSITLTASYGTESSQVSNLFGAGSTTVWGLGAGLLQPLFHGGELHAKKRAAVAAFDQANANYREVVLQSFRDVADTLLALEMDSRTLTLQRDAESAAGQTFALVRQQYQAGAASYLELLTASQQYQQASINLTQAEAARFADSAALIHALGGGWWNHGNADQKSAADGNSEPASQQQGANP